MINIDQNTPFGARVARRLSDELIIWLTTTRADGTPEPSPVWFLWDGNSFLIYSQPDTPKLRHLARNPKVALNFDGDGQGGDIVVFTGEARIARDEPPSNTVAGYQAKYRAEIGRIGMTPETFASAYAVPIRIEPTRLRGH